MEICSNWTGAFTVCLTILMIGSIYRLKQVLSSNVFSSVIIIYESFLAILKSTIISFYIIETHMPYLYCHSRIYGIIILLRFISLMSEYNLLFHILQRGKGISENHFHDKHRHVGSLVICISLLNY